MIDEDATLYPQALEFKNAEECVLFRANLKTAGGMNRIDACAALYDAYNHRENDVRREANSVLDKHEWFIKPVRVTRLDEPGKPHNFYMGEGEYAYTIIMPNYY